MTPLQIARGELARLAGNGLRRHAVSRGFQTSSRSAAAQNFAMPALSPTMTEGNIAKWNKKEGDSFSAGDVILEVETDKASMDVEAQDDGILAKITVQDGTKGIKVGTRIGVIAEPDDDISSLEIPAEESAPAPKEEKSAAEDKAPKESAPAPKSESDNAQPAEKKGGSPPGKAQKQIYPLYPSVSQLLHENGLDKSEADKIPASGPNGRLLKGDVLSYLGTINASYSSDQSTRINKLGHLDLSNIKIAPSKQPSAPKPTKEEVPIIEEELDTEIAVTISFKAVREVQQRIQNVLGIDVPLSTFINRAVDISNSDLPPSVRSPTTDELFNDVLGLNKIDTVSYGAFVPQVTALPGASRVTPLKPQKADIIDILAGTKTKPNVARLVAVPGLAVGDNGVNVFSISVAKGDEKRARVFLERVKTILQVDPGRLVL